YFLKIIIIIPTIFIIKANKIKHLKKNSLLMKYRYSFDILLLSLILIQWQADERMVTSATLTVYDGNIHILF
ncbi:hypothetical protein ACJX0J_008091, partial [Zea mays]